MAIRMTGLTSGLDTESIVNALMEAQKAKKTKVENSKTKLEWQQEIWASLNTKLYSFYTDYLGKMRLQTNYQTKKVTSSDSSKVTATANSSASTGSNTVKVNQLASAQKVTSAKLNSYQTVDENGETVTKSVTESTKLSDLGIASDGSTQINVTAGDSGSATLLVNENTTVKDFLTTLQNAGLNASYDAKQGRFFITSKESGEDQAFTITTSTLDSSQMTELNNLKDAIGYNDMTSSQQNSVMSTIKTLQNSTKEDRVDTAIASIEELLDKRATTAATAYYTEQLTNQYEAENLAKYITTETQIVEDADGNQVETEVEILTEEGRKALEESGKDNDTYVESDRVAIMKGIAKNEAAKSVTADLRTDEYKEKISSLAETGLDDQGNAVDGITAKADRDMAVTSAVQAYAATVENGVAVTTGSSAALQALGLDTVDGSVVAETSAGEGMVVIAAADSIVEFNGATLRSSSTTLEVNGLTLTLTGVTDEAVNLSVANDTQGVYDSIKEFINQYNSVLAEMNTYYYADSARGYDPLTDEQKEAMSDDEVEKWETKIKDSLLRRDSTLDSLLSAMRSVMTSTTITASNGKTYSLANLGITTGSDYKEYGLLHIKGDEDDTEYADETNTLMNLLNEDPAIVTEVLSGITGKLYENLQKQMQSTKLSSALTFYNDKYMNEQLSTYKKEISEWETKLADLEDRYYSQFTAMEKALASLQSQQSALAGYLGS